MMLDLNNLPGEPEQLERNANRKFTAREEDGMGLSHYRHRYYHSALGRFVGEDPLGFLGGINLYAYVGGNPMKWVDPLGFQQKSATFQCDGSGGYEVVLNWAKGSVVESCVTLHEEQHIKDWQQHFGPDSCKGKPKGYVPKGGPDYDAFLRLSECHAFSVEEPCEENLLKKCKERDKQFIQKVLDDTRARIKLNCVNP
jgi:RHS repeat-associated protein